MLRMDAKLPTVHWSILITIIIDVSQVSAFDPLVSDQAQVLQLTSSCY